MSQAQAEKIRRGLRDMVLEQVEKVNRAARDRMLYVTEGAGLFMLFGRPHPKAKDRLMSCVSADIDGFAKLWLRLNQAAEGV